MNTLQSPISIAVLPGDGIGPEVMKQALNVLTAFGEKTNLTFDFQHGLIGGAAIDAHGVPLPEESLNIAKACQIVLLGAVGDFKYDTLDPAIRPEQGLLQIRKALGLYANVRPVKAYEALLHASTLKPEVLQGSDMVIVRELTGGLYFGQPKHEGENDAVDTLVYHRHEIERIAHVAFQLAQTRTGNLCSVDKANVLASSRLWRKIVEEIAPQYPTVKVSHMYVDNAAMQLILNPRQFDVMLTENTFGDILSDEASMLTGSLGMLASASYGEGKAALYEPSHGSAPTIANQNIANPIATILSLTLLVSHSLGMPKEALMIDEAVNQVLLAGFRTADIMQDGCTLVGTTEMGDKIVEALKKL
ncbi:MAG: 3-isopropylmalate dehydrogenase [Vampirovibrio sp.]|jgi:3-isopropylmalate dehydrogenase|nr:3-isopropylmalate dehydrogenase [Vampirovibrio sp.]